MCPTAVLDEWCSQCIYAVLLLEPILPLKVTKKISIKKTHTIFKSFIKSSFIYKSHFIKNHSLKVS